MPARAAGQPGPGAARDDRDAMLAGEPDERRRPRRSRRERDGAGQAAPGGRPSRRGGRTRGRSRRSGAGGPGAAARTASIERRPMVMAGSVRADAGRIRTMRSAARASGSRCVLGLAALGVALAPPSSPASAAASTRRAGRAHRRRRRSASATSSPGSVDRSSLAPRRDLRRPPEARRGRTTAIRVDATLVDHEHLRRPDRPRRAQHDRRPARGHAARPGDRRRRRGQGHASATRRSSCRSAASCRPAASTTVRVRYGADLRTNLAGSNWLFTKANGIVDLYRWLPWVSRKTAVQPAEPRRPVRDAVEPARSGSRS